MEKWINKFHNNLFIKKYGFQNISLNDRNLFNKYIKNTEYDANIWSSNFSYLWAHNFSKNLTIYKKIIDDLLITFILTNRGRLYLPCLPLGEGGPNEIIKVLNKCAQICNTWNKKSKYYLKSLVNPINTPQLSFLKKAKQFNDNFYIKKLSGLERHYSISKIINLSGKEFSKVRYKINKFNKTYANYIIRKYKEDDFPEIIKLGKLWEKTAGRKYRKIIDRFYFEPIIKYYKELNHIIIVIELNNKIIGMTSAEILPTGNAWGCITKFDNSYSGLSEKLTFEIAKEINKQNPNIETINVGSDLGSKGLAFYKDRFRPVLNYERYALFYKT